MHRFRLKQFSSSCRRVTASAAHGFTLLEALVVLALIATAAVLVIPRSNIENSRASFMGQVYHAEHTLKRARSLAIGTNQEIAFLLDIENRWWKLQDGQTHNFPESMDVSITYAGSEGHKTGVGEVVFYPDGSSTGGRLSFLSKKFVAQVEVDWLTGRSRVRTDG